MIFKSLNFQKINVCIENYISSKYAGYLVTKLGMILLPLLFQLIGNDNFRMKKMRVTYCDKKDV